LCSAFDFTLVVDFVPYLFYFALFYFFLDFTDVLTGHKTPSYLLKTGMEIVWVFMSFQGFQFCEGGRKKEKKKGLFSFLAWIVVLVMFFPMVPRHSQTSGASWDLTQQCLWYSGFILHHFLKSVSVRITKNYFFTMGINKSWQLCNYINRNSLHIYPSLNPTGRQMSHLQP